jgi:hypothetical protein
MAQGKRKASGKKAAPKKARKKAASGRKQPSQLRRTASVKAAARKGFLGFSAGHRKSGKTKKGKYASDMLTPKHVLVHRIELLEKAKKKPGRPKTNKQAYAMRKAGKGSYMSVEELDRRIKVIDKRLDKAGRPD